MGIDIVSAYGGASERVGNDEGQREGWREGGRERKRMHVFHRRNALCELPDIQ